MVNCVAIEDRSPALAWHYEHIELSRARARARYHANKDLERAKNRAWYKAHPGYKKAWVKANPELVKRYDRSSKLKYAYGITLSDYNAMLNAQGGVCAICKQPCKTRRRLAVDHNHVTGKVRGLLCNACNNELGRFVDSSEILKAALDYINEENY